MLLLWLSYCLSCRQIKPNQNRPTAIFLYPEVWIAVAISTSRWRKMSWFSKTPNYNISNVSSEPPYYDCTITCTYHVCRFNPTSTQLFSFIFLHLKVWIATAIHTLRWRKMPRFYKLSQYRLELKAQDIIIMMDFTIFYWIFFSQNMPYTA